MSSSDTILVATRGEREGSFEVRMDGDALEILDCAMTIMMAAGLVAAIDAIPDDEKEDDRGIAYRFALRKLGDALNQISAMEDPASVSTLCVCERILDETRLLGMSENGYPISGTKISHA